MPGKSNSAETWLCPLCGVVRMKYGTTCKNYPECGNQLHITGKHYYNHDGSKRDNTPVRGVGISAISNEDSSK